MTDITPEDKIVELTLEIDTMPQYFLVRAFIVDKITNFPLCKQYENDRYTRQMQEFFAKTTDDFDQDRVLNLDEDKDNNFVVYNEDTVVIENTDTNTNMIAKADRDNMEYVIENIDSTVASLQPGDIFYYKNSGNDLLIVRVASINISGTTAAIRGGDIELKDVFDYVRIDVKQNNSEAVVDNSDLDEGIEYIGEDDSSLAPTGADDSASVVPFSLNYKLKEQRFGEDKDGDGEEDNSISGTVALKFEVEVSFHYDAHLFADDDVKLELALKYDLSYTVEMELKIIEWEFELGKIIWAPVPGVTISFTPSLVVEGSIKIELVGKISGQIGKKFENGVFSDNNIPPHFDATYKAEGELFIGISLKPEVSLLWEVASASLSAKAGVKATAKIEYKDDGQQHDEKHMCIACIDGELDFVFNISLKLTVLDIEKLTYKADLLEITCKLCDFYYSIDNNKFAFTKCPNKAFKTTITLLSPRGVPLFDSKITGATIADGDGEAKSGKAVLYFKAGKHEITVEQDGKEITTSLNITGASDITLKVDFSNSEISTQTSDAEAVPISKTLVFIDSGKYGDNISWSMTDDYVLYISGSGDMPPREELIPEEGHIQIYNRPWSRDIRSVVIDDGITSIGEEAFWNCEDLKSVEIPDSVTSIGKSAFIYCDSLESVVIPESVTYIGKDAFHGCDSLESVVIPDSVKTIDGWAFNGCTALRELTIGDSVEYIGSSAFANCEYLDNIVFPDSILDIDLWAFEGTGWYDKQPDGVVYAGKVAYKYKGVCPAEIKIKDGTLGINQDAFEFCDDLKSVTLPDSLRSIDRVAFYGCENLESINIPDSVTFIGTSAFAQTAWYDEQPYGIIYAGKVLYGYKPDPDNIVSNPTEIMIKDGTLGIAGRAFFNTSELKSIDIPDSVTYIGDSAFEYCKNLMSVTIPDSVTSIGGEAFIDCESLTSIMIPDSVTDIGEYALGYYHDIYDYYDTKPIDNFIIYGHSGTAAEEYANSNNFYFGILSDNAGTGAAPAAADTSQTSVEAPVAELTGDTDLAAVGASDIEVSEFICTRDHLIPGTEALLVILRSGAAITPGNLLYIAQQTVSESGKVEISCFGDFGDNAVSFIIGQCDHSSATWHTTQEATAQEGGFAVLECNYCNKIIDTKEANSLSDTLLGDTDGDGEVTILDATAIQRHLASIPTFAYIEAAADTDGDGEITIIDATYIQRWLVNLKSNDNIGKPLNK